MTRHPGPQWLVRLRHAHRMPSPRTLHEYELRREEPAAKEGEGDRRGGDGRRIGRVTLGKSYFVKLSWGWTLSLLLPFIGLTNYIVTRSVPAVFRRIGALLVGTIIWYSCTNIFTYIENVTGSCYESTSQLENKTEHGDKRACIKSGGIWVGFDISGHSFLLPYCVLMILEEAAILRNERFKKHEMKPLIHALVVCLGLLAFIWTFMFFCTSIYFHTLSQKLFGTFFGILAWYVTYKQWYLKTFSPGLPPSFPPGKIHRKSK